MLLIIALTFYDTLPKFDLRANSVLKLKHITAFLRLEL